MNAEQHMSLLKMGSRLSEFRSQSVKHQGDSYRTICWPNGERLTKCGAQSIFLKAGSNHLDAIIRMFGCIQICALLRMEKKGREIKNSGRSSREVSSGVAGWPLPLSEPCVRY